MFVNNKKLYTGLALILSGLAIFIVAILLLTKNVARESYDLAINTNSSSTPINTAYKTSEVKNSVSSQTPPSPRPSSFGRGNVDGASIPPAGSLVIDINKAQTEAPKEENTENITVTFGAESVHLLVPPDTPFYDDLVQAQNAGKIHFTGKNYKSLGFFLTDIGELHSGYNKNLLYYINGKEATVGVSTYKPQNGDIISWKLE